MHGSIGIAPFASFALPFVAMGAAGAAVATPVLIHLLSRQRFQVVHWAAMRFLSSAQKRHRKRIDHWLLMLVRVGVLALLLAGLCATAPWAESIWQSISPGAPESTSNAPRTHHVLVIDATLSMSAKSGEKSRFETSIGMAEDAIRDANPGDGFSIIVLAGGANILVPGPANDPDKVLSELKSIKPTHLPGDMMSVMTAVSEIVSRSPRNYPRRQVTIFTDLQRSAWTTVLPNADRPPPDTWQRILGRAEVAFVDVAKQPTDNLAVTDLSLADPLPLVDSRETVSATVQNFGRNDRRGVRVELLMGRPTTGTTETRLLPIEQKVIESIPPGERASVSFSIEGARRFREPGLSILQVRLVEGDELPADDVRNLVVDVRTGLNCLLVNGKASSEPLRRSAGYLTEALAPGGRPIPENPAKPRVVSLAEFGDTSIGDVLTTDCAFLCDVSNLTPTHIAKLESILKRGGGVIIGLGPNAAANLDFYNRILFNPKTGLASLKLTEVVSSKDANDAGYRLTAAEESFRKPPLDAFRDDNSRGGLTSVPFKKYVRVQVPGDGLAQRILSFTPANPPANSKLETDPAVIEIPKYRGRLIVYTSTFNSDWTDWPVLPSFLPFAHELLRYAATAPDRHTIIVGDAIEEFAPPTSIGTNATIGGPEGLTATIPLTTTDDGAAVRFPDTTLAGLYRVNLSSKHDSVFAVNTSERPGSGGSESDLRRVDLSEIKSVSPAIQVVESPKDIRIQTDDGSGNKTVVTPKPHGPTIARWVLTISLIAILAELLYAWRVGPGRSTIRGLDPHEPKSRERSWFRDAISLIPLLVVGFILLTVLHHAITGHFLGFLSHDLKYRIEQFLGVPSAGPGEGTHWRLESATVFQKSVSSDRRILIALTVLTLLSVLFIYRKERAAVGRLRGIVIPVLLRTGIVLFVLVVVLPQLRLSFEREGWPDVAIILDTSASMATSDAHHDESVKKVAEQLAKIANLANADRLALAQALVAKDGGWIQKLLADRQVKVHVYAVDEDTRLVTSLDESADVNESLESIKGLKAVGPASRLGDGVKAVLKSFRGGSLSAAIVLTDGQTTAGDNLLLAAREAARSGIPLYLVGFGDPVTNPDLSLTDLRADDVVMKNDQLVFEARLTAAGPPPPATVPVVLSEMKDGKAVELARVSVRTDATGKPVPFRLTHTPLEAGEKTYIIETPAIPGETDSTNNRIERVVIVTETKRLKVLFIDGYPRYEFRFVKDQLERESDAIKGNKSIDLSTLQLSAAKDYSLQDKSALRSIPTRDELFQYDVVLLGDVDPRQFPHPDQTMQDLADFVKIRGGGLLAIAGEQASPQKLFDTPLGDVLPILPAGSPRPSQEDAPITEGYKPRLTAVGQFHPLFRLSADENQNTAVWNGLKPFYWYATGYKRKLSAEVLVVHPEKTALENVTESYPLVLQQFAGSGRVVFFGFDETWRWRYRDGEEKFNQFWTQVVRVLGRNRVRRVELRTDRQTPYRQGEPIKITVRFPDDAPAPDANTPIRVVADRTPPKGTGGDLDSQTIQLVKVEGSRATYEGFIVRTPPGDYRFRVVSPEQSGNPPRAEAKVLPPPGEGERLDMNVAEMTRAARESRGRFFTLADADQLIDSLPEAERVPLNQPCPPIPLWSHAGSFAILVSLFATEWWYRRRERLV